MSQLSRDSNIGKTVIVTGAGSGIGRATAILFGRSGANVVAVDQCGEAAYSCANEIEAGDGVAHAIGCDISCEPSVRKMVGIVATRFSRIDHLVSCAGVMVMRSAALATAEDWARSLSTNVTGAALTARYCCEEMKPHGGGSVVLVSSICGYRPDPGFATYAASKAALLMLMRSMALDYGSCNIRVNAVSPGPVETPGLRSIIERANADWSAWKQSVAGMQCLKNVIQPEDIGKAILFLCSDDARMITGTSLAVDGGLLAKSSLA